MNRYSGSHWVNLKPILKLGVECEIAASIVAVTLHETLIIQRAIHCCTLASALVHPYIKRYSSLLRDGWWCSLSSQTNVIVERVVTTIERNWTSEDIAGSEMLATSKTKTKVSVPHDVPPKSKTCTEDWRGMCSFYPQSYCVEFIIVFSAMAM